MAKQPVRDLTNCYRNTLVEIFDRPDSSSRRLKTRAVIDSLVARWTTKAPHGETPQLLSPDDGKAVTSPLFWLSADDGEEVSLEDFVVFLVTATSPGRLCFVDPVRARALSISEHQQLLDCVVDAGFAWTFALGRFNTGLREILAITSGILGAEAVYPDALRMPGINTSPIDALLTHLVNETVNFEPDVQHLPTISDIGRAFEFFLHFFLRLPSHELQTRLSVELQIQRLARFAWTLMTKDIGSERRRYLNLIDGDLLPWAIIFERSSTDLDDESAAIRQTSGAAAILAADRFDLQNTANLDPEEIEEIGFLLEFDGTPSDGADDTAFPHALSRPGKGNYSFKYAFMSGHELADKLGLGNPCISLPYLDQDLSMAPDEKWKEQGSTDPIDANELVAA